MIETKTVINFGITLKIYLHAFRRICIIIRSIAMRRNAVVNDCTNKTKQNTYDDSTYSSFTPNATFQNFNNDAQ